MGVKRYTVAATTNGSGVATAYTSGDVRGAIHSIQLVRDGTNPLADTADITITGEDTGLAILSLTDVSADFTKAPRLPTHDTSGVASLYAAGGEPVEDRLVVSGERVKIAIAQGGASMKGTFYVTVLT